MVTAIPVLDLFDHGPPRRGGGPDAFARDLRAAFEQFGFVGIRGHGIAERTIDAAFDSARSLFALPASVKHRYEIAGGAGQRGYTRLGVEKAKDQRLADLKEFWHVGREAAAGDPLAHALLANLWPVELPAFRAAQLSLFAALETLGARLLAALATTLGLPAAWFTPRIDRGNSILRAICYPPIPPATRQVRAAAHEDINLITLLVGSQEPGLEIRTCAGEWLVVTTLPGTIVVNVGDMLQRLTNDVLRSTTHRVVNPPPPWATRPRHSIPFFLHFNPAVVIETLASCITPSRPNRHPKPITANDYLRERLREIGLLE